MKRLYIILFAALLSSVITLKGQEGSLSGLSFSSYEVILDQRTSLDLTPTAPLSLPDGFAIDFDINIRPGRGVFGYIFRIIGNDSENIDLVFNHPSEISNLWLVYQDEILVNYKWEDLPSFEYDQWTNIRIDFDVKDGRLKISLNEKSQEIVVRGIKKLKNFQISFGACKYKPFYSTDVCPMTVRNIRIYKPENKLYRQWKLDKHAKNKVYDVVAKAEASVENPSWLIDRYLKWEKIRDIHIPGLLGITSDATNKRLFFINEKMIYTLPLDTWQMDSILTQGDPYPDVLCKNIIYNKYTDEIWSYSFAGPARIYDFRTNRWSAVGSDSILAEYAHHNKFFSPLDQSLVTILGYGYYKYKSIVNIYNPALQKWTQIDRNDQIIPRYLSSAGFLNDRELLVFGGYGSKSGRQELSPTPYYDLYTFDLEDYSFHQKWVLETPLQPFVPSETLVIDPAAGQFYTLLFDNGHSNSYLQLAAFSIDKPEMKLLGDSIPFRYEDTSSWIYLLLDEHKSNLVAVVSHLDDISIYTLAYKPLTMEETMQPIPAGRFFSTKISLFLLLFIVIAAGVIYAARKGVFSLIFKKRKNAVTITPLPPVERRTSSSLYLLGDFLVCNHKGEDITSIFTPTLKQLFLLILFSSVYKKGVLSSTLDEVLWYDKIGESARNNRNVNISKLRSLLEDIGEVEIVSTNSVWNINCSEKVYCDCLDIISLQEKLKGNAPEKEDIYRFLSLLQTGELLPDMSMEWMQHFKEAYTNEIGEVLTGLLSQPIVQKDTSLHYHIGKCLLNIDTLNGEALSIVYSIHKKIQN